MSFVVYYRAWDTSTNAPATGDTGNHTVNVHVDGSPITGLTETEVANGLYYVTLTDEQLPKGSRFAAYGSSVTSDVIIVGESGVRPEAMRGTDGANTVAPDNSGITAIKSKTDNLPSEPAAKGDLTTSGIAEAVWSNTTRTLTAFSFDVAADVSGLLTKEDFDNTYKSPLGTFTWQITGGESAEVTISEAE